MRGRSNRKGPSPLTRTYESTGPDVKIRGTAQHVAEKYLQLARDAQSSGDPVAAENLLQHAEHYFRIIAAAQTAQQQAQLGYGRNGEELDEGDEDDDFVALPDRFASPLERAPQIPAFQPQQPNGGPIGYGGQPQPYFDRPTYNPDQGERQNDRPERQDRNPERAPNYNGERPERQDRQSQDRQPQDRQQRNDRRFGQQNERNGGERQNGQGRNRFRDQPPRFEPSPGSQEQPRVDFDAIGAALPAFITAPTRTSTPPLEIGTEAFVEPIASAPTPADFAAAPGDDEGENRFHLRPRRRRRVRSEPGSEGDDPTPLPETSSAD
ncbi:DUF4167 domain-containing protein [uncultured Rhodoblastus sp.]|uniref:DUF4167 domain-containing protein n=1 Tax=uncultured Rhodoblastus sp. TaxID=543037 RepID=UPI0025FA1F2F|nr:DUF4167 domain-containing protein [uncultured Rhodoblastus sp.]